MNRDKQGIDEAALPLQAGQREFETGSVSDASTRLLAAIVESSDDAIVSKNLNGIVTSWNSGAERIFGYRAEEMIGQSITRIIPQELLDDERTIMGKILCGERIEHFETLRLTKRGELIDVSLTVSPVRDSTGRVIGAAKVARDITQRKRVERTMREDMDKALHDALEHVKILSGLLPICAGCKKIRNELGSWQSIESYIGMHSEAEFTHGMCPECAEKYGWTAFKKKA